jgi:23S rRNA pseudouridine1911/1915/1917 synthase
MQRFEFQVNEKFHRRRLDEFLFDSFTSFSKAYIRRVVKAEQCQVNGYIANTGVSLRCNDFVEVIVEPEQGKAMTPQKMRLKIVYEDEALIVIDKKNGLLVHPTHFERDKTLLNGITYYLNEYREAGDGFVRPHLVHRLDRETSGLLVVAKTSESSARLCRQIKKKVFKKKYLALVEGAVKSDKGEIDAPIGRDAELKRHLVVADGKASLSRYEVLTRTAKRTLLEMEPVSGRTNQLRIHCDHIGHPICGDEVFGGDPEERLCLHASGVSLIHPTTGTSLSFDSIEPDFVKQNVDGKPVTS